MQEDALRDETLNCRDALLGVMERSQNFDVMVDAYIHSPAIIKSCLKHRTGIDRTVDWINGVIEHSVAVFVHEQMVARNMALT